MTGTEPTRIARTGTPAFAVRGIIEGFYGTPWTHAQRLDMIDFVAAHGMNTFVYSPKDDPLMRHAWRSPYLGESRRRLSELIDRCRRRDVTFVFCLSPGLSIQYSSSDDIAALTGKLASVGDLGVTAFGLLLDDIPTVLQHAADRARFADLVDAHIALIESVYDDVLRRSPRDTLYVCPTAYWGYGDEEYLTRLGRGIDPRIEVFHTGRAICSATIDLADAATAARSLARPVTYWDNYPVNDVAMGGELHIGPYRGRDRHLYRFATGVIANGMELAESSKIAFATIADYLWSPEQYDPEASWRAAIDELTGPDADAFRVFADNVRSSCLAAEDSPVMTTAVGQWAFLASIGETDRAEQVLADAANSVISAVDQLTGGAALNQSLVDEARPWLEAAREGARALLLLARHGSRGPLEPPAADQVQEALARFTSHGKRVFGDLVQMTVGDALAAAA
ncbi:MAG: hypothetical protein BGO26_15035 [Actinobacteria bacterium 69-20]|nr:beta-N-acetylglucosaminidase domain-containing protein [Actinomycetota bacterium]OJV29606.1 MAG: hypothetical protein BGO26_15035 [Actinobacteria bacterium 69-20]